MTSKTDQLGRVTNYGYDSLGNLTSITRLAGAPQAVTTTYTYTSAFSQLASVTDPLHHTWSLGYDTRGDLTGITDPRLKQVYAVVHGRRPRAAILPGNQRIQSACRF